MTGERQAYIAILLFEFVSPDSVAEELYREDTTLVHGHSEAEARAEAERWGRAQEGVDEATGTVVVGPHFLQVVDLAPVLDDDLIGTADLYSRHFRDLGVYRRWEPLLGGEPGLEGAPVPRECDGRRTRDRRGNDEPAGREIGMTRARDRGARA